MRIIDITHAERRALAQALQPEARYSSGKGNIIILDTNGTSVLMFVPTDTPRAYATD